jgi:chromate transport protein ChrA
LELQPHASLRQTSLGEVALLFARLGATSFGGPAVHIAMMRDEVVTRRRWVTDAQFLDLLGASNLIPGPTSTEMAIHVGHKMAGWRGRLVAGACFIMPATVIVGALAWTYVRFGALPQAQALLYGVTPVVVAIIAHALWSLTRTAVKSQFSRWPASRLPPLARIRSSSSLQEERWPASFMRPRNGPHPGNRRCTSRALPARRLSRQPRQQPRLQRPSVSERFSLSF